MPIEYQDRRFFVVKKQPHPLLPGETQALFTHTPLTGATRSFTDGFRVVDAHTIELISPWGPTGRYLQKAEINNANLSSNEYTIQSIWGEIFNVLTGGWYTESRRRTYRWTDKPANS